MLRRWTAAMDPVSREEISSTDLLYTHSPMNQFFHDEETQLGVSARIFLLPSVCPYVYVR
jgi:hypothetical protein